MKCHEPRNILIQTHARTWLPVCHSVFVLWLSVVNLIALGALEQELVNNASSRVWNEDFVPVMSLYVAVFQVQPVATVLKRLDLKEPTRPSSG